MAATLPSVCPRTAVAAHAAYHHQCEYDTYGIYHLFAGSMRETVCFSVCIYTRSDHIEFVLWTDSAATRAPCVCPASLLWEFIYPSLLVKLPSFGLRLVAPPLLPSSFFPKLAASHEASPVTHHARSQDSTGLCSAFALIDIERPKLFVTHNRAFADSVRSSTCRKPFDFF